MTVIPIDYAEVTLNWTTNLGGEPEVSVFGVHIDEAPVTYDVLAQAIADDVNESFLVEMPDNAALKLVRIITGDGELGEAEVSYFGELDAPIAPPNVTHLLTKATGYVGRRSRGRMYLPSVAETKVDAVGVLDPVYRAAMTTAGNAFLAKLQIHGVTMVVLGQLFGSPLNEVLSLQCQNKAATQRRRLR